MRVEDNHRDSFEQMLRETTDRFTMNPSARVWFSLYNNIHPSRRWPSAGSWLLFIFFLFILEAPESKNYSEQGKPTSVYTNKTAGINPSLASVAGFNFPVVTAGNNKAYEISGKPAAQMKTVWLADNGVDVKTPSKNFNDDTDHANLNEIESENLLVAAYRKLRNNKKSNQNNYRVSGHPYRSAKQWMLTLSPSGDKEPDSDLSGELSTENNAEGKFGYEIYATPSIGFRGLSRNTGYNPEAALNNLSDPFPGQDQKPAFIPAFNMEAGGSISYALSEIMRFKAGVQLNYSKYNIEAGTADQPSTTYLMLNNPNNDPPVFNGTTTDLLIGAGADQRILSNQSYQLSLPIGADFKLANAPNLEWFAGASVQPTFILPGSNYLLSADANYLIPDDGMVRNWNINGGIETFISYHAGKGIRFNAGPQFRYQILSTYKNQYTYNERLYNIGIKLGISSRF